MRLINNCSEKFDVNEWNLHGINFWPLILICIYKQEESPHSIILPKQKPIKIDSNADKNAIAKSVENLLTIRDSEIVFFDRIQYRKISVL